MKHLKLITEQSYEIVSEKTEDHKLYITGVYSSADVRNINGRIYKRDLLEREISRLLSTKIKDKSATGELGHPDRPDTTLDLAAILTESLEWQGNHVIGKSRVLTKLPKGEVLSALIEEGVLVGISSRGLGTVSNEGFVNEDLQILTWDCVSSPSNPGSWIKGIYEAKSFLVYDDCTCETKQEPVSEDTQKRALDEYYETCVKFLDSLTANTPFNEQSVNYDRIYNMLLTAERAMLKGSKDGALKSLREAKNAITDFQKLLK